MKVLITGGNGQLGSELKQILKDDGNEYVFTDVADLDLTNQEAVNLIFDQYSFDYCINCAAYTAVDKAEEEQELAYKVNASAVQFLADACKKYDAVLIQVSTDFIFNGKSSAPITEDELAMPLSVYGDSKLLGEKAVKSTLDKYFILRTSWVYSEFGNNFVKSMRKFMSERSSLNIVFDQVGSPTYAADLAEFIALLVNSDSDKYGVYHYSNQGVASWYDFAVEIKTLFDLDCKLSPILSEGYPTPATRPNYSVMDKSLVTSTFNIEIPHWKDSLRKCVSKL